MESHSHASAAFIIKDLKTTSDGRRDIAEIAFRFGCIFTIKCR